MTVTFDATREQIAMLEDPAHVKIWACGRRWGKSILMAIALTIVALKHDGCTVWYVSPRYARSLKMMRVMGKSEGFKALGARAIKQFPPRFELPNGSEICFISGDREEELRGEGLRLICLDEGAVLSKNLYENVLLPMTADSGGTMVVASTFNGRNWFYDLAVSGMPASEHAKSVATGADSDCKTWIYPTRTGYAFTGSDENRAKLERLKARTGPLTWKQEYECEPLSMIDAVFQYVDQCVTKAKEKPIPQRGHRYVIAQDIGRIVDASGVVGMDLDTGEVVYCEGYPLGMRHDEQAKRTLHTAATWNQALVVLDTTGGASGGRDESAIKYYSKVIPSFMPITWTVDTKRNMVNRLGLDFEKQRVLIPDVFKELIAQAKLYRYKFSETAIQPIFYGRPDDQIAALMMCAWAREKGWGPMAGAYRGML